MRPDARLTLLTGGTAYGGWKAVRVQRRMDHAAGGFELSVTQLWPDARAPRRIEPQERCEVLIDSLPVVTGYIDAVEIGIDGGQNVVQVTGRDATADLVDCSAVRSPGQWRGQRIERIAQDLAAPFGITVRADVDTGKPLTSFALQEGETVFEAIERAARIRALLLMTDGTGALVITRAGLRRVATRLVLGGNVLKMRATLDMRDRFSSYTAKGQAPGGDLFSGRQVAQISARATDPGVTRYRPLVLVGEAPDLAASLNQRVQWEANVRAAASTSVEVTVTDWFHGDGLWEPNTLVALNAPELRIDDELLIAAVEYSLDEQGPICILQLTRADAYTLLPIRQQSADVAGAFWSLPKAAGQ